MADKREKKDVGSSAKQDSESDSDSYHTAEGSAHSLPEGLEPLPWRSEHKPDRRSTGRHTQSMVSMKSISPSVFGEDQRHKFDSDVRRPTIDWPSSGCIHIPLRPPREDRASNESTPSQGKQIRTPSQGSDNASDGNPRSVRIRKPSTDPKEDELND